jgi:uncharacterized protein
LVKVVLDTSILVGAFLRQSGVNARILHSGRQSYDLYLSEEILEEMARVLFTYERIRKRYHYSDEEAREYLEALIITAKEVLEKLPKIEVIKEDPKDNHILACGLASKADYIVSKDNHLTDLGQYRGIKIVPSLEFVEILKRTKDGLQRREKDTPSKQG